MIIKSQIIEQPVRLAILRLEGKLDGANYEMLIDEAGQQVEAGIRYVILDLGALTFISSAGLAGIHQVALLFQGEKTDSRVEGWAAFHSIDRDRDRSPQRHVKLAALSDSILKVMQVTGFASLFEIHPNLDSALASFQEDLVSKSARQPAPAEASLD